MNFIAVRQFAIRSTAGLMAAWLSGVLFLFCCAQMNEAAPRAESDQPANLSAHCDKAPAGHAPGDAASSSEENCFNCCGFIPLVFDKARKIERDQKQLAAAVQQPVTVRYELSADATRLRNSLVFAEHLPKKQDIFLINRVFRI